MHALAAVAIAALIAVSTLIAIRLLLLHRRTGASPELLLGGMLLLSVGVSYPLYIAADRTGQGWLAAASGIAVGVGFSLLFVFTWRVFRPRETWARILAAAGVITLLGRALYNCADVYNRGMIRATDVALGELLVHLGPITLAYVWTASESLRYHGMMRRRVKLGLADAVVTNRFLLWGIMGLFATAGMVLNTGAAALKVDVLNSPGVLIGSAGTGLAQAVLLVLAFFPPRSYLSWIRVRSAVSEA